MEINRHPDHPASAPEGSHLHLDVPAVIRIIELEAAKTREPDRAERAQIAHTAAVDPAQHARDEGVPHSGVRTDSRAPGTRPSLADDEIRLIPGDRGDEAPDLGGREEVVGIHEDENLGGLPRSGELADAGQTGPAVARSRLTRHGGAALGRDPCGVVRGAVVDYDHQIDTGGGEPVEEIGKTVSLVTGRNQNRDALHGLRSQGRPV